MVVAMVAVVAAVAMAMAMAGGGEDGCGDGGSGGGDGGGGGGEYGCGGGGGPTSPKERSPLLRTAAGTKERVFSHREPAAEAPARSGSVEPTLCCHELP